MRADLPPPNEFESAILRQPAVKLPALAAIIPQLRVLKRDLTPCGSYTDFESTPLIAGAGNALGLSKPIAMPGVKFGMDGILFFKDGRIDFLEIVAYGDETWNGRFEGFLIPPDA